MFRISLTFALLIAAIPVFGQHAGDIEFGYDDVNSPTSIVIEPFEVTLDGYMLFESEFAELDPFNPGDFSSDEPGFNTNRAEGLLARPNDRIFLSVLDASTESSFGVGFVNYYNPVTDSLEAVGRIGLLDNSASTADLILSGTGVESGAPFQFIGLGDIDGDVHDHIVIDLLDDSTAPLGAYGIMLRMHSDFDVADGVMDISSDPFWIVVNHGLDETTFETAALSKFGITAVPEPSGILALGLAVSAATVQRRRRSV